MVSNLSSLSYNLIRDLNLFYYALQNSRIRGILLFRVSWLKVSSIVCMQVRQRNKFMFPFLKVAQTDLQVTLIQQLGVTMVAASMNKRPALSY